MGKGWRLYYGGEYYLSNGSCTPIMAHVQRVRFISQDEVANVADEIESVSPWGWDSAIKFQLMKLGIHEDVLPF